jgi:hypothetical protein
MSKGCVRRIRGLICAGGHGTRAVRWRRQLHASHGLGTRQEEDAFVLPVPFMPLLFDDASSFLPSPSKRYPAARTAAAHGPERSREREQELHAC